MAPDCTKRAAWTRFSAVMRLSVPNSSSLPHRPALLRLSKYAKISDSSITVLDDFGGSQLLDPLLVVAEDVTEDLIGVLAGHRDRPDLAGSLGQLHRHAG